MHISLNRSIGGTCVRCNYTYIHEYLQEVVLALQDTMHGCLALAKARHLLALVLYQQHTMADLHLFAALCCLAERVFSIHLW